LSASSSRWTFAGILGAALLVWSADASARVAPPLSLSAMITPSLWVRPEVDHLTAPDPVSLLPREPQLQPLEPVEMLATQGAEVAVPCGLFLGDEPRLTLFDDPRWWEPEAATIVPAWHTDKGGQIVHYDQIPRRWDRPTDYGAYAYPVGAYPGTTPVTAGYDLDLPDEEQRRGTMRAVGHGGVDLPQPIGAKISMINLDHQLGDAKVVHVGTLFGHTVVTLHSVREGGERAHYLLVFGHLDRAASGLEPGHVLRAGELVGFVGKDSESPGFVHLHLEARRIRDGVDPAMLVGPRLVARDVTVVTDPRNVLPIKPVSRASSCKERRRDVRRAALYDDLRLTFAPYR
jgi:hypothetical protein